MNVRWVYEMSHYSGRWNGAKPNIDIESILINLFLGIPFGRLPMVEVGGQVLTQPVSICRYLGRQAGLCGDNAFQDLQIDIIADTLVDLRLPVLQFLFERIEGTKKLKKDAFKNETLPFYFKRLDAIVKENEGYLANKRVCKQKLSSTKLFLSYSLGHISTSNNFFTVLSLCLISILL
ncbi:transferase activity protein [Homalodisca vitripennis]|nr:transferase activity protein [Homalodisca vitripennis]